METRDRRDMAAGSEAADSGRPARVSRGQDAEPAAQRSSLTKEELQNLLFRSIGLSKRECRDMVNSLFEELGSALEAGEIVKLEGFGRFQPRQRPRRWARNLRSGERIAVSERRVVTFHPSRKLIQSLLRLAPAPEDSES